MPVTVRDLEVAQVLAREVKAAAARSAGASLRADQIKLLFGAAELDAAERERIQAALEMVGLDPQPSLLEVDGDAPVALVARPAGAFPPERRRRFSAAETSRQPPSDTAAERGEFPTVGEFARSTFERARRRLSDRDAPAETNGGAAPAPRADPLDFDYVPPATEPRTAPHVNGSAAPEADSAEPVVAEDGPGTADPEAARAEREAGVEHESPVEPESQAAAVEPEPLAGEGEPLAVEPESQAAAVEPEPLAAEPEPLAAEPEPLAAEGEPLAAEGEPLAAEGEPLPATDEPPPSVDSEPEEPVAVAPRDSVEAAPVRRAEIAAVIAAAAILPVIGTSIAGWHFGLPYLALAVAATGWLVAKDRAEGGSGAGVVAAVRSSPLAHGALRATALLTIVSVVAAVLLASASTSRTTAAHATPAALGDWMRPVTSNARRIRATAHRHRVHHRAVAKPSRQQPPATSPTPTTTTPAPPATAPATQTPTAPATPPAGQGPPASSGTQGLYEVPSGK